MAANIWRPTVVGNNYNNPLNWSLAAVPLAGDGNIATFDNNILSGPCTVNVASQANIIDFTSYNNTITFTNTLTVSGNVTLGLGMTFAGVSQLIVNANAQLKSNGKVCGVPLNLNGASTGFTYTLMDSWIVNGLFTTTGSIGGLIYTINSNTGVETMTSNSITFNGGSNSSGTTTTGTAQIICRGTGTVQWTNTRVGVALTLTGGANTITLAGTNSNVTTGFAFKYVSGTIAGSIEFVSAITGFSLDWGGNTNFLPIGVLNSGAGHTITILSDIYMTGRIATAAGSSTTFSGAFTWHQRGNVQMSTTSTWSSAGGFLGMIWEGLNSSSNLVWSGAVDSILNMNITMNTPGTITFTNGNSLVFGSGTFTYTAGTVITTNTILFFNATCTLNLNGIVFNNLRGLSGGITITLTSNLNATGSLSITSSVTWAGTGVWSVGTLIAVGGINTTTTLVAGQTYTAGNMNLANISTVTTAILSSVPGTRTKLNLTYGGTQTVQNVTATDIDSSAGQTIWNYGASALTNTINWNRLQASSMQKSTASFS